MVQNRTVMRAIALFLLAIPLAAQEGAPGERIQPSLSLMFRSEVDQPADVQERAVEVLFSTVEGAFRDQRRYFLDRAELDIAVESIDHPVVVMTVSTRPDGTLGVELDIWDGNTFVTSRVFDLPVDQRRFAAANAVAGAATDGVEALFDGFGRIRFTNEGYPEPFYVFADNLFVGASIDEIELPAGTYELEVRRREDGFEHVVGRSTLELQDLSYIDVRFSMDEEPPPVPGYLRLIDPNVRWTAIFDFRGSFLIPMGGFPVLETPIGVGGFVTGMFNDAPFRGFVLGLEAGHVFVAGRDQGSQSEIEYTATPLMGTLGLSVGPVGSVDFAVRGSAGMALTGGTIRPDHDSITTSSREYDGVAPTFGAIMEFGLGFLRAGRISLHASWFGILEDEVLYSMVGVGFGAGGRF